MLVLDAGAVTRLAGRSSSNRLIGRLRLGKLDKPFVPTPVLIECLRGRGPLDAEVNHFLKKCTVIELIPESLARRAANLRTQARRGSAVDALLVALAEPDGRVLTSDLGDLRALASYATGVVVEAV